MMDRKWLTNNRYHSAIFPSSLSRSAYQSKIISEHKNVTYDGQQCPIIAKGQRAHNAQLTHQIVNRHNEELKSSSPDSQTLKNPV